MCYWFLLSLCLRFISAIINVMQDDLIQLKVNNLIALRQLLSNFVIVTVSGTIGMLFTPHCFLKYFLLVSKRVDKNNITLL